MSKSMILSVLAALVAVSSARMAYQMAADVESILSAPLSTSFSCNDLPYGYYADVDNNCEIFHVCFPIADEIGALVETAHFTFACGNGSVFSQETLTCDHKDGEETKALCQESRSLYQFSNADFGKIPDYEY